jgi:hypothetical protein
MRYRTTPIAIGGISNTEGEMQHAKEEMAINGKIWPSAGEL